MDRHFNVNCDACHAQDFKGLRYKCLICYDIDLCERCYDSVAVPEPHLASHPMQCILTRKDVSLYFGGEFLNSTNTHSYTCPFCGQMGFSLVAFVHHNVENHADGNTEEVTEVICPVCVVSGANENYQTRTLTYHLISRHPVSEHQDLVPFEAIFNPDAVDFHNMGRRATFRVFSRLDSLAALDRTRNRTAPNRAIVKTQEKPENKLARVFSLTNTEFTENKPIPLPINASKSINNEYLCSSIVDERESTMQTPPNLKADFVKDVLYSSLRNDYNKN